MFEFVLKHGMCPSAPLKHPVKLVVGNHTGFLSISAKVNDPRSIHHWGLC